MSANKKSWLELSMDDTGPIDPETACYDDGYIALFDPGEIRNKVGVYDPDGEFEIGDGAALSNEEQAWRKRLQGILEDPKNPQRKLLIASEKMVSDVAALEMVCPHFNSVIGLVGRAVKLSFKTRSSLIIPPLLLVGPPGLGKTYFARGLAAAIGTEVEQVGGDLLSDRGTLTGLSLSWRAARSGRIANALLNSATASPVILVDEVDKVNPIHHDEKVITQCARKLGKYLKTQSSSFCRGSLSIDLRSDALPKLNYPQGGASRTRMPVSVAKVFGIAPAKNAPRTARAQPVRLVGASMRPEQRVILDNMQR